MYRIRSAQLEIQRCEGHFCSNTLFFCFDKYLRNYGQDTYGAYVGSGVKRLVCCYVWLQSGNVWTDFVKCPVSSIINTHSSLSVFFLSNTERWTDGETCRSCRLIFANFHRERADGLRGTVHCVINNGILSWKFAALCGCS
jgi:hypothetical protein